MAREKEAHERGVGTSRLQRFYRDRRLRANLDETMGKLKEDPETGQMVREGGLTKFRRDEAARAARSGKAYDEEGRFLAGVIRDKDGKIVGSSSTARGRMVMDELRRQQGPKKTGRFGRPGVDSGTFPGDDPTGAHDYSEAPDTWDEIDKRNYTAGRLNQRSDDVRRLLNQPQVIRNKGKRAAALRDFNFDESAIKSDAANRARSGGFYRKVPDVNPIRNAPRDATGARRYF